MQDPDTESHHIEGSAQVQFWTGTNIVGRFLQGCLAHSLHVRLSVAWVLESGLTMHSDALDQLRANGLRRELVVGVDRQVTTRQGIELALLLFDSVFIVKSDSGTFHPKVYLGVDDLDQPTRGLLVTGSPNLTAFAHGVNTEAALALFAERPNPPFAAIEASSRWMRSLPARGPIAAPLTQCLVDMLVDEDDSPFAAEPLPRQPKPDPAADEPADTMWQLPSLADSPVDEWWYHPDGGADVIIRARHARYVDLGRSIYEEPDGDHSAEALLNGRQKWFGSGDMAVVVVDQSAFIISGGSAKNAKIARLGLVRFRQLADSKAETAFFRPLRTVVNRSGIPLPDRSDWDTTVLPPDDQSLPA